MMFKGFKFKGTKRIYYLPPFVPEEKNSNFVWKVLFEYYIPLCPYCGKEMFCKSLDISTNLQTYYTVGVKSPIQTSKGPPNIKVSFQCSKCKGTLEGLGKDLRISESGWLSLEEVYIENISLKFEKEDES